VRRRHLHRLRELLGLAAPVDKLDRVPEAARVVDRYLFVKLLDGESAERVVIADHLQRELASVAGADRVTVGVPADDSASRWDLSIVVRAEDVAAWERIAARVAPLLTEWLPARAAVIKAWTFQLRPAG
jgi:hypothetical protein